MYAIIGVTGHVGGGIARNLLAAGLPVRAILRNEAKAKEWQDNGATVAFAELTDALALENAFAGTEGVFIMTPPLGHSTNPMADHDKMLQAISTAIEKAKPKKVVYLSSIGAQHAEGTGAIKKLHDLEQTFHKLTVPATAIRAGWFMENFSGSLNYASETGYLPSFINPANYEIPMVAAKDISLLATEILQEEWNGHRLIELEGPCRYSTDNVAAIFSHLLKKDITAVVIPEEKYEDTYLQFGLTAQGAALMAEMITGFNTKKIVFEEGGITHKTGRTLLEDALKTYLPA